MVECHANTNKYISKKNFEEYEKDPKRYGKLLMQSLIITKTHKKSRQTSLYINYVITTDDKAIANHFNKFFTAIADKLIKKIPQTNRAYHDYLKNSNEKSLFMHPANPDGN